MKTDSCRVMHVKTSKLHAAADIAQLFTYIALLGDTVLSSSTSSLLSLEFVGVKTAGKLMRFRGHKHNPCIRSR